MTAPRTLSCEASTATISPVGAQVLSWAPTGDHPVLWCTSMISSDPTVPVRGGIPICMPWFGPANLSPASHVGGTKQHGFARTSVWEEVHFGDAEATYQLTHAPTDADGVFPHAFTARLDVAISEERHVDLTMTHDAVHPFTIEAALHAYIAVGDLKDATVHGLEGEAWRDNGIGPERVQHAEVSFVRPVDRIYPSTSEVVVQDPRWLRRVTIEKAGSETTILWTPWAEGARTIADLPDSEWQHFVCVEPACAREGAITLDPRQSHTLSMTVSVTAMD